MQSKLYYETHTKNVDLEPLKNTQYFVATPQFLETLFKTDLRTILVFKEGNKRHMGFIKQ